MCPDQHLRSELDGRRVRRLRSIFVGYGVVLIAAPALVWLHVVPFSMRHAVLYLVAALGLVAVALARISLSELGIGRFSARHLYVHGVVTSILIAAAICAKSVIAPWSDAASDVTVEIAHYVFVSSSLQELIFRSILHALGCVSRVRPWVTIGLMSGTFAFMHVVYDDHLLVGGAMILGVAWSVAYRIAPNLIIVWLSHAIVGLVMFWLGFA